MVNLIDQVRKLQAQGMEDRDVAKTLREKGFSPKEVIDAISQSKIKAEVEGTPGMQESPQYAQPQYSPQEQYPQQEQMPQSYPYPQQYPQAVQPDYSQYPQQGYAYSPAPESTESLKEIAEEVAEEKVSELREKFASALQNKKEDDSKAQDMERRIKQLENSFQQLQSAILGKIADYSKDLRNMTDEMHATQETFKKVLNPVVDKVREKKKK